MHCAFVAGRAEVGRVRTEIDAVQCGGIGASTQLNRLSSRLQLKHTDQGTFLRRSRDERPVLVDRKTRNLVLVSVDNAGRGGDTELLDVQYLDAAHLGSGEYTPLVVKRGGDLAYTFGVVAGRVCEKQFGVVGKTVGVKFVAQHHDDHVLAKLHVQHRRTESEYTRLLKGLSK